MASRWNFLSRVIDKKIERALDTISRIHHYYTLGKTQAMEPTLGVTGGRIPTGEAIVSAKVGRESTSGMTCPFPIGWDDLKAGQYSRRLVIHLKVCLFSRHHFIGDTQSLRIGSSRLLQLGRKSTEKEINCGDGQRETA